MYMFLSMRFKAAKLRDTGLPYFMLELYIYKETGYM